MTSRTYVAPPQPREAGSASHPPSPQIHNGGQGHPPTCPHLLRHRLLLRLLGLLRVKILTIFGPIQKFSLHRPIGLQRVSWSTTTKRRSNLSSWMPSL
ncbi:hypothetical protein SEVIR_7G110401v4 [Setaria viridis]